jgi:hypothetical protein
MNRFQFALAQIGRKEERVRSLGMLLGPTDLPGKGWVLQTERSWRTGASGHATDEYRRAHRLGLYSAVRTFKQGDTSRSLLMQLMPFESQDDAASSMSQIPNRLSPNPKARVQVMQEQAVEYLDVPGVGHVWAFEQRVLGQMGPSATRYISGNVDNVVLLLQCTALGDGWPWADVMEIAGSQAGKIVRVLNT